MNNEYRIEALTDFIKIPAEKRTSALYDFQEWLAMVEAVKILNQESSTEKGMALTVQEDTFTWIDDGKPGLSEVRISFHPEPQPSSGGPDQSIGQIQKEETPLI